MSSQMTFPAALNTLSTLAAWLAETLASLPLSDEWRYAFDLAACETATNIIRHALHEDERRTFSVECLVTGQSVMLRFTDSGDALSSERLAAARRAAFSDDGLLSESGRGLMLILLYVDTFNVAASKGINVTTLEKFFSSPAGTGS